MKHYNNLRRLFRAAAATMTALVITFAGCTKVDDTLGSNLIPEDQQMKAGFISLGGQIFIGANKGELNPKKYVETRLFQTDSIVVSNIAYGYMGSMVDEIFGGRSAGFLSQYTSYYLIDSGYFGYRPIFDSAQIMLSINKFGTDTLTPQLYSVYEIIDNKYLTDKPIGEGKTERDTIFYLNFDPQAEGILSSEPIFTFTFPDGEKTGPKTTAVTMSATDKGKEFVQRLMLLKGNYTGDYSIYSVDSLKQFVNEFKGLYITPAQDQTATGKGTIYETTLESSGFTIYGRNRVKDDPTLIKDTIGMVYLFYDTYSTEFGNVSINNIRHDYSKATAANRFDIADARETNPDRPLYTTAYVEGMGGVVTQITFTQEFFDELDKVIADANAKEGKEFKTLAFNQVRMSIFFPAGNYDWQNIDPSNAGTLIEQMESSQSRLGLYTNFKRLTGIPDYNYYYETTYGTALAFDGRINRSRGCYVMDITSHIQVLWSNYMAAKAETPEGEAVDLGKVKNRSMYLGPEAYSLFTTGFSIVQGMTPDPLTGDDAPIRFDIAYNLIK